jgi:hypothetical protein
MKNIKVHVLYLNNIKIKSSNDDLRVNNMLSNNRKIDGMWMEELDRNKK